MRSLALSTGLLALALVVAASEEAKPKFKPTQIRSAFIEQFGSDWSNRWTPSEATKKTPVGGEIFSYVGEWKVEEPSVVVIEGATGLVAKSKAAHHAISAPLSQSLDFKTKPLVIQYEVKYQKGGNCGGGYLKLLEDGFQSNQKEFSDKTAWVVMFGPDLTCPGTKVHFIFRHKSPVTGEYEEKHLKLAPKPAIDTLTKLYTLAVNPDNTYEIFVDGESLQKGSLLEDFDPPVNPPSEIDDTNDSKPADWVDTKRIPDPDAKKPDDWDEDAPFELLDEDAVKPEGWLDDEPTMIPDPDSEKPEEWDDEEDGDWIPPSVSNPKCEDAPGCGEWKRPNKPNPLYKGKWFAPSIDNPAYIGEWSPRKIANPDFFEDMDPVKNLEKIGGIGIELWTMTEDILFSNIYLGNSLEDAKAFAAETFEIKKTLEASSKAAAEDKEDVEGQINFREDPVGFIREKVFEFIDMAQVDPLSAAKSRPETAAGLALAVVTFFGMLTVFVTSLFGGQSKPVAKPSKKTDAPTPDDKAKADTAPVSNAGDDKKKDEGGIKKRK